MGRASRPSATCTRRALAFATLVAASCAALTRPALAPAAPAGAAAPASAAVKCPLAPASGIPGGEAWAFTQSGASGSSHAGISSSYIHGRGSWRGGHGTGTICIQDSLSAGGEHTVVLAVSGASRLSPGITRVGHVGAGLVLGFTVAASDDPGCAAGTRGTATLFASYYEGHHDLLSLRFDGACAAYEQTFSDQALHVAIARDGHQL